MGNLGGGCDFGIDRLGILGHVRIRQTARRSELAETLRSSAHRCATALTPRPHARDASRQRPSQKIWRTTRRWWHSTLGRSAKFSEGAVGEEPVDELWRQIQSLRNAAKGLPTNSDD